MIYVPGDMKQPIEKRLVVYWLWARESQALIKWQALSWQCNSQIFQRTESNKQSNK